MPSPSDAPHSLAGPRPRSFRAAHPSPPDTTTLYDPPMTHRIVVIGGGPGGSTAATLLARQGFNVTLFERDIFPREHVGESLLPASIPILENLGVIEEIEAAGFTPKYGATMVWGKDPEPWSWHFAETNASYPHAYQVWRPTFDQMLLNNAERHGVDVRQGWRVVEAAVEAAEPPTLKVESNDGATEVVEADWIVDASGQNGFLATRLDLRVNDEFFRNLAVYSYFRGADRLPEPDAGNIFIEAYEHGWSWAIPLPDDVMSVGVVVDAAWGGAQLTEQPAEQFYRQQLSLTGRTAAMLDHAQLIDDPRVIRDWSYTSQRLVGDRFILVGDAACFIDPLFSSGVHLAMSSAVLASAYVTSALRDPEMQKPAAEVYTQLYMQQYHQFREMAALFYASNRTSDSYFWEARRLTQTSDDVSPREAFIAAVAGQPPQGYERVVLERGEAPADFVDGVAAVEMERSQRDAEMAKLIDSAWPDRSPMLDAVPALAEGVSLARKPVIGDGQFEWGAVMSSPKRPQGAPISMVVAALATRIDGRRTVRALLRDLFDGVPDQQQTQLLPGLLTALRVLYVDGMIAHWDSESPLSESPLPEGEG
ncbi:MAG: tryptophan 7-halogenase [Chloroflexi bacterium]|nr:tryptophan 7-halogenase [Chloroflexota bacterium]